MELYDLRLYSKFYFNFDYSYGIASSLLYSQEKNRVFLFHLYEHDTRPGRVDLLGIKLGVFKINPRLSVKIHISSEYCYNLLGMIALRAKQFGVLPKSENRIIIYDIFESLNDLKKYGFEFESLDFEKPVLADPHQEKMILIKNHYLEYLDHLNFLAQTQILMEKRFNLSSVLSPYYEGSVEAFLKIPTQKSMNSYYFNRKMNQEGIKKIPYHLKYPKKIHYSPMKRFELD